MSEDSRAEVEESPEKGISTVISPPAPVVVPR